MMHIMDTARRAPLPGLEKREIKGLAGNFTALVVDASPGPEEAGDNQHGSQQDGRPGSILEIVNAGTHEKESEGPAEEATKPNESPGGEVVLHRVGTGHGILFYFFKMNVTGFVPAMGRRRRTAAVQPATKVHHRHTGEHEPGRKEQPFPHKKSLEQHTHANE